MPIDSAAKKTNLVLLGLGHTHLHILRQWQTAPLPKVRLLCVSNQRDAAYSGMLPGVLAGDYSSDQMKIDLVKRCEDVGAELILAETSGIDRKQKQLLFHQHPPINFDLLSVGIGSRPAKIPGDQHAISIKPMQTFLRRLAAHIMPIRDSGWSTKLNILIVGGGAGGVEIACCLPQWLKAEIAMSNFELTIVQRGERLLKGASQTAAKLVHQIFDKRGYQCLLNHEVTSINPDGVTVTDSNENQRPIAADLVISAVGAIGPPLLASFDLELDKRGFILTNQYLQSTSDSSIFAVGDTGTCQQAPSPKAGVYAVRQGPVLWKNLNALLSHEEMHQWKPQKDFLWLLNRGDKKAILQYGTYATQGRWCWWLKKFIDTRFVAKHQSA